MTRVPITRWVGLSVLMHLALAGGLLAAILTFPAMPVNLDADGVVMTVMLIGDASLAMQLENPSPLAGEGQGGGRRQNDVRLDRGQAVSTLGVTPPSLPSPARGEGKHPRPRLREAHQNPHPGSLPKEEESTGDFSEQDAPAASSTPGVSVDDAQPETATGVETDGTDTYRPLVLAALNRAKRYPLFARRRGIEGAVEIAFVIHQDGRVSEPEVTQSSQHAALDDAALSMVQRLGLLPPPPGGTPLRFPARIQYRLNHE